MAFEIIENMKKVYKKAATPENGVKVTSRKLTRADRFGGGHTAFIRVAIGAKIAKSISLTKDAHNIRLAFGTDADAGKIQVSVDNAEGGFPAKRNKTGGYALTINRETADGLFAVSFPEFTVDHCEAIRPENGKPPYFVFKASVPMLAVED